MSTVKWIAAALALATLSLPVLADPLVVTTRTTGHITALDRNFHALGGQLQAGMPITVDFANEYGTTFPTVPGNPFTVSSPHYFYWFDVAADGNHLAVQPVWSGPLLPNGLQWQDNVLNAAGELVDVLELSAGGQQSGTEAYTLTTRLEYAPTAFSTLDPWSLLAVQDAPLLAGTMYLHWSDMRYDGTVLNSSLYAQVDSFAIQFSGPATEGAPVPVPEPGQYALLMAGLAGAAASRVIRRRRKAATAHAA